MIDLAAIETRCEAARREVNRVCQKGKWTMSVPVREDDSDIILTNSFRDIPVLVTEVARLRELIPDAGMLNWLAKAAAMWWKDNGGKGTQKDIAAGYALVKRLYAEANVDEE